MKKLIVASIFLISGLAFAQTTVTLEDQCNCAVLSGTAVTAPGLATPAGADAGDIYINSDTGIIYFWDGDSWELSTTDDQNAEEVLLVVPTDFDGDSVNETNVEEALNAISNSGEWVDGSTDAAEGDGILAKQADANGATIFVGDDGKVRMMSEAFDSATDGDNIYDAQISKKYTSSSFSKVTADQLFESSRHTVMSDASDVRYTALRPELKVDEAYSGSSLTDLRGIWGGVSANGTSGSSINTINGITGAISNKGEGTITTVHSFRGLPIAESGTITNMNAFYAQPIIRGTGSVGTAIGFNIKLSRSASGALDNYKGIQIQNQTSAATVSNYGIMLGNISGAATNYSIYTNNGQVSLGDELQLRTVNTGAVTDDILTVDATGVVQKIAASGLGSDDQDTSEVNLETALDIDGDGNTEATVQDALAAILPITAKAARVFYPPSIAIDASVNGTFTVDLHAQYIAQFGSPVVSSAGTIPTYTATELDYHVTYADATVFNTGTMSISAAGVLTYTVSGQPADYNSLINVVFVVK